VPITSTVKTLRVKTINSVKSIELNDVANNLADELSGCHLSPTTTSIAEPELRGQTKKGLRRTSRQPQTSADEELMDLIRTGDHDAFASLFDRYYKLILSIALKILRNDAEAQDLMQEVFFEVYRKAADFDANKGTLKFWIMRYAYSRSINRARYLSSRGFYNSESHHSTRADLPQDLNGSWKGLTMPEWTTILENAVGTLTPRQRETLERVCYQGQSMAEIAAVYGETIGNVRNHYYRALRHLRRFLRGQSLFEEYAATCEETVETGT